MLHEVLEHAFEDSIRILPFLFLTYLVMEYIQHKTGNRNKTRLRNLNKYGPVIGSVLGIFPQCGFSSVASNFYTGRIISLGTLISVYLTTSDEMLPVMISQRAALGLIIRILLLKMTVGFLSGTLLDLVLCKRNSKLSKENMDLNITRHSASLARKKHSSDADQSEHSEYFSFSVYKPYEQEECYCCKRGGILFAAVRHSFSTFLFIFLITAVITFGIHEFGEDKLAGFVLNQPLIGEALAGIIGLIPNCAASVVLTELYLGGGMTFSAMMSGLFAGSGVGILVLFRENRKHWKENMKILGLLYGISVAAGWVIMIVNRIL